MNLALSEVLRAGAGRSRGQGHSPFAVWGVGCCRGEPQRDLSDSLGELVSLPRGGAAVAGFQRVEEVS